MNKTLVGLLSVVALLALCAFTWWLVNDPDAGQFGGNAIDKACAQEADESPGQGSLTDPLGLGEDATSFKREEDYEVSDTTLAMLGSYADMRNVELRGCSAVTDNGAAVLGQLKKLERVDLYKTGAGDNTARALASVSGVTHLDVSLCDNLTDEGVAALAKLSNLKELRLSGCTALTDSALRAVAKIETLEVLDLSWCPGFTNDGLQELTGLPRLRELYLHHTPYGDDVVVNLRFDGPLHLLDLRDMPQLTQGAVVTIRELHANCRVLR